MVLGRKWEYNIVNLEAGMGMGLEPQGTDRSGIQKDISAHLYLEGRRGSFSRARNERGRLFCRDTRQG